ncbi:MAG: tyrosine recombinase XerC [Ndongobacter sp.]|nr:tyrosine recombinase XerC [Ndongobacter sp.]
MYHDIPPILEDFLNYQRTVRGLSANTIREYYYDLRGFLRFIQYRYGDEELQKKPMEEIPIRSMRKEDLARIDLNDLHAYLSYSDSERGDSPTTRARKMASLRSFYKYLTVIAEYFEKNPAAKLSTPKVKKRHPVYLTLSEAVSLIETSAKQENVFFRYRDIAILVTFLTTGIRLSELCGMNLASIRDHTFNVVGKGNKERKIYMTESCEAAIDQYLAYRPNVPNEKALFLSSRKQRMSPRAVQHRIEGFLREAGFDTSVYSTHKLRHTAATLMYKEGVDIRTLQRILGHTSVATTQIYTHVEDELVREAMSRNPLARLQVDPAPEKKD